MTPEEWKAARRYPPGVVYGFEDGAEEGVMNRHRMAAMCLYDQPYGFTRDDVALCQGAVERAYQMIPKIAPVGLGPQDVELRESMTRLYSEEMHQWISLANRITALLPPE